jgi:SPP1 family predicted phage head-tail adaptor
MNIGQLDRRITIEQSTETQSAYGDISISSTTLKNVWAHVIYKSGNEKDQASRMTDITVVIFTIRYNSDVTQQMRINWDGAHYFIDEVLHHGRKKWTQLKAKIKV